MLMCLLSNEKHYQFVKNDFHSLNLYLQNSLLFPSFEMNQWRKDRELHEEGFLSHAFHEFLVSGR